MTRLIRKELREKLGWLLAVCVLMVIGVLFDDLRLWFVGESIRQVSGLTYILMVCLMVLFSLSGFSSELTPGRADFLLSRPVSWKKLLAAKVVASLAVVLTAALIGSLAAWLALPQDYAGQTNLGRLCIGVLAAFLCMLPPILLSAGFSCVLGGVFGGMVVGILSLILPTLMDTSGWFAGSYDWCVETTALLAPVASLVLLRFGLTLTARERVRRFAFMMGAALAISSLGGMFVAAFSGGSSGGDIKPPIEWLASRTTDPLDESLSPAGPPPAMIPDKIKISPDGSFAAVARLDYHSGITIIRLRDGISAQVPYRVRVDLNAESRRSPNDTLVTRWNIDQTWSADNTLVVASLGGVECVRLIGQDRVQRTRIPIGLPAGDRAFHVEALPKGDKVVVISAKGRFWIMEPSTQRTAKLQGLRSSLQPGNVPWDVTLRDSTMTWRHYAGDEDLRVVGSPWISENDLEWARHIIAGDLDGWTPVRYYR